ncbi:MAG: DUF3794 domain-containing protein [Ruminococcaceae bacterium]|nr:DUF3794 domain-containing protein [Oscillospiraceae bacterium]
MGMDFKTTNFDVSTEQIYLEQTTEIPIDVDFTLSDYEGDIKKVLNCEITPYITSKQITGSTLIVEGEASIKVIYSTPDGELFYTEKSQPFKKNFESNKNLDDGYCDISTTPILHSCRAVTERKISIRSSLKVDIKVTVIEKNEIISDIDCGYFEQLKGEAFATIPLGKTQKIIIIDEEIDLPQNLPDYQRIIRTNAVSYITDCKIVADKTIIKGNLKVTIFYCTEDNEFAKHCVNIPFNQIVDIPGISDFCECDATSEICGLNISARSSDDEENRKFILVGKLEISVFARCSNQIPIIYDLYSTKYTAISKCDEVKFSKLAKHINEAFLCKKVLSLPNGEATKIFDIWCKCGNSNIKYQNNSAIISGTVTVYTIYENSDGIPDYYEKIIDFEYPINFDEELKAPYCVPEIKISDCDFSLNPSNEPEIKLELLLHAAIYDTYTYSVITDLTVDQSAPLNNSASLIAYYADKGENVWDIAKSFSAKLNELLKINHLTEDTVPTPKMLLIPRI